MDPRPLTLRQLWRMAMGRRREAWEHTAAVLSAVCKAPVGNPYRAKADRPRTPEDEERESREAFRLLETGLKSLC